MTKDKEMKMNSEHIRGEKRAVEEKSEEETESIKASKTENYSKKEK